MRRERERTHHAEFREDIIYRRPVGPHKVDEHDEALVVHDHLSKSRPRAVRHWVLWRYVGPLGDVGRLKYRRPYVYKRESFRVREEESQHVVRVFIQERGDVFEVRWCASREVSATER